MGNDSSVCKPAALPLSSDAIPAELRALHQFGVWRFEQITDETTGEVSWDKIPCNARTGYHASSTNPRTWSPFEFSLAAYDRGGYDGLAFFLRPGGGLVGIDVDRCRDTATGEIEPRARRIVDKLDTYTELSPSARGLRSFLFGELPPRDRREGRFECYSLARFLTLTGHRLHGVPGTINHRQVELIEVHTEIFAARVAKRNTAAPRCGGGSLPSSLSDLEIIERAGRMRNGRGERFRALWSGDARAYRSHSEADAALCGYLAFFCGPDPARIDELFRGSGLYRSKWNRADYRDSTIRLVLDGRTEYYRPNLLPWPQRHSHAHDMIRFSMRF